MKKKAVSILLALVLCLGLVPTVAFAADSDFTIKGGVLTKYDGPGGNVVIPSSVVAIGDNVFQKNVGLSSITIPNTVRTIGKRAFQGCIALSSVVIPDSVVSIGTDAFRDCTGLGSVTLSNNIHAIADATFGGCIGLGNVTIPQSVNSIGSGVFENCSGLTSITVLNSTTAIGGAAFRGTSLTDVYYVGSQEQWDTLSIDWGNDKLVNAKIHFNTPASIPNPVPQPVPSQSSPEDFTIKNGVLQKYEGTGGNVVIPSDVVAIGNNAFQNCVILANVTIPSTVKTIGNSAFRGCIGLSSIVIPDSVVSIGTDAFRDCTGLGSVTLSNSMNAIADATFGGCIGLGNVTIPQSVNSIGSGVFENCSGLTSITVLNSTTAIGGAAFRGTSLTDVYYVGSQEQWDTLSIDWGNDKLVDAKIHFNTIAPSNPNPQPTPPSGPVGTDTKVTGVTLSQSLLTMKEGESVTLTAAVTPSNAANQSVTWSSNNNFVASVDSNGYVTALASGSAVITVTTVDGGYTTQCRITVEKKSENPGGNTNPGGNENPGGPGGTITPPLSGSEVHFPRVNVYFQDQFTDVSANQWYTSSVASAFELGLMRGSDGLFNPYGDVTIAEAVTMAARIHCIYTTGSENFVQTGAWYQVYLDYAYRNGIINDAYYNCDVMQRATRAQFAEIFANALPDEGLKPVSTVADNAIPDVPMSAIYASHVYKLYRAGILTGGDVRGTFSPDTYITRMETATIASRMAESNNRVAFTL